MKKLRNKSVEFAINGTIAGVKAKEVKDGILETRDSALIHKLRALPDEQIREVFRERVS